MRPSLRSPATYAYGYAVMDGNPAWYCKVSIADKAIYTVSYSMSRLGLRTGQPVVFYRGQGDSRRYSRILE